MFLQEEGLTVIIAAIMRSKKVFERVKNYIIYRSATSLRLMEIVLDIILKWIFLK